MGFKIVSFVSKRRNPAREVFQFNVSDGKLTLVSSDFETRKARDKFAEKLQAALGVKKITDNNPLPPVVLAKNAAAKKSVVKKPKAATPAETATVSDPMAAWPV